jgi:hypothetical protein
VAFICRRVGRKVLQRFVLVCELDLLLATQRCMRKNCVCACLLVACTICVYSDTADVCIHACACMLPAMCCRSSMHPCNACSEDILRCVGCLYACQVRLIICNGWLQLLLAVLVVAADEACVCYAEICRWIH